MKVFLFLLAVSATLASDQFPRPVVFENVTVIDTTGRRPKQGVTVVISNGRIQSVTAGRRTAAKSAQIIDGRGKFLIPGLWDMHVHMPMLSDDQDLRLYIANGVTGVRVMWGGREGTEMGKDIAQGKRLGP